MDLFEKNGELFKFEDESYCNDPLASGILRFLTENEALDSIVYTLDDKGVAMLFIRFFGDEFFYCTDTGRWYHARCGNWQLCNRDDDVRAMIFYMLDVLCMYEENESNKGADTRLYRAFLRKIRNARTVRSIAEIAALRLRVTLDMMDGHPYIINTPGKAYDLKTPAVIEKDDKLLYHLTKSTEYVPATQNSAFPEWNKFILEIMSGDEQKAKFLQRALGYSLLGDNREECMFIAYGSRTRNGKSTLFSAIVNAIGTDYCETASADLTCGSGKRDVNSPSLLLASLTGKRFLNMNESDRSVHLNAALVKTMTGRDRINVRDLYGKTFSYLPQFTMWLNTNYLPEIDDPGIFASERIHVIEFNEHFSQERQDKDLKTLFTSDKAGAYIMGWLIEGATDYILHGLGVPDCVKQATKRYEEVCDRVGCFISEKCEKNPDTRVYRGYLYKAYKNWCCRAEIDINPMSAIAFFRDLESRGYDIHKCHGEYYVHGLNLRQAFDYCKE